jgi:hypothetical protein
MSPVTRVFYSWESDLPNATNRSFIEHALQEAAKRIRQDETIEVEPVIDRDTAGVSGSPDISATIFKKIDESDVFVADISIIGMAGDRPTPNPNVLFELGYAKKALGSERLIMVLNTAFGSPEQLPFDLRPRRVVTYRMIESNSDRATERKQLQARLEAELRTVLGSGLVNQTGTPTSLSDLVIESVRNVRPDQGPLARQFMQKLAQDLDVLKPDLSVGTVTEGYDRLISGLATTVPLAVQFGQVSNAVALHDAAEAGLALFEGFSRILDSYSPHPGLGTFYDHQFDYYRFLGHEFMVMLFAPLIRENRWQTIKTLLEHDIPIRNGPDYRASVVTFEYASRGTFLFPKAREVLRIPSASLQADLLQKRHTEGELGAIAPIGEFMNADYFLFLRSVLPLPEAPEFSEWDPWSCALLRETPPFLLNTVRVRGAERLLGPLGVPDILTFRVRLQERRNLLQKMFQGSWRFGFGNFDPTTIGTRQ